MHHTCSSSQSQTDVVSGKNWKNFENEMNQFYAKENWKYEFILCSSVIHFEMHPHILFIFLQYSFWSGASKRNCVQKGLSLVYI